MDPNSQQSLLAELDARQDDVLQQLDALNREIEDLLTTWLGNRRDSEPALGERPVAGEADTPSATAADAGPGVAAEAA